MNLKDISDKLKDTILPRDEKKEGLELKDSEKKETTKCEHMENEQKPISDEVEQFEEQPLRIKTMFVKSEDEADIAAKKKKLMGAAKVAAGIGIVAAAGLAAFLLGSRKKRW
jgi:hypothetical protein